MSDSDFCDQSKMLSERETPSARRRRTWLVAILAWLLATSLTACGTSRVEPRPILVNRFQCLEKRPPSLPTSISNAIQEAGCPQQYVCLSRAAAVDLGQWMRAMWDWAADAYGSCGPAPRVGVDRSSSGV